MARITIEVSEDVETWLIHQSIEKKFKGKIKPFLEQKLLQESEGKKVGNKQTKMKL